VSPEFFLQNCIKAREMPPTKENKVVDFPFLKTALIALIFFESLNFPTLFSLVLLDAQD